MGWLTVAAYFAAFILCFRVALLSSEPRSRAFWTGLTVVMFALGVNKQLDLQTWFTLFVKRLAKNEGWYEQRRIFQALFIFAIAAAGAAFLAFATWYTRRSLRHTSLAVGGAIFLGAFIVIRAASFHHVDQMLHFSVGGLKMNWILELGGIALVAAGAWSNVKRLRRPKSGNTSFIWVTAGNRPGP